MAQTKPFYLLRLLCVFLISSIHITAYLYPDRVPDNPVLSRRQSLEPTDPGTQSALGVTFQVAEPVIIPSEQSSGNKCVHKTSLMEHVFAFSYGHPFVGMMIVLISISYWLILSQEHTRRRRVNSIESRSTLRLLQRGGNSIAWV